MAVPVRSTSRSANISARSDQLGYACWPCRAPSRDGNAKLGIALWHLVQQLDRAGARTTEQRIDWSHTRGRIPCAQSLTSAGVGILPARGSAPGRGSDADRGLDNDGHPPGIHISSAALLP